MAKKIFITGTGTDVGKTYISALIVKKMRESGFNCGYFKPVISGVTEMCGHLMESDANYVIEKAKIPTNPEECLSYYWQEAVSPHLAAKRAGDTIDIEKIKSDFSLTVLRKRLFAIIIAIAFLFLFVIGRLFYVQVIWGEELQEKAIDQWTREIPIISRRGQITDCNGVILAVYDYGMYVGNVSEGLDTSDVLVLLLFLCGKLVVLVV